MFDTAADDGTSDIQQSAISMQMICLVKLTAGSRVVIQSKRIGRLVPRITLDGALEFFLHACQANNVGGGELLPANRLKQRLCVPWSVPPKVPAPEPAEYPGQKEGGSDCGSYAARSPGFHEN